MKKYRNTLLALLGVGLAIYGAFLFKKAYIDKGYPDDKVEKEILLEYYVVSLGLDNTKENRDKFRRMTIPQLRKELQLDDIEQGK